MEDWKAKLGGLLTKGSLPEGPEDIATGKPLPEQAPKETLHVVVEKKGRGGKTATIVEGFECDDDTLSDIAAIIKRRLGCGGSARGGEILIQGNCVEKVKSQLHEMGYRVK